MHSVVFQLNKTRLAVKTQTRPSNWSRKAHLVRPVCSLCLQQRYTVQNMLKSTIKCCDIMGRLTTWNLSGDMCELLGTICAHILNMYAQMRNSCLWLFSMMDLPDSSTHFLLCHLHLVCYGNRAEVSVFVWRRTVDVWNTLKTLTAHCSRGCGK